jgi:hypothetical protein
MIGLPRIMNKYFRTSFDCIRLFNCSFLSSSIPFVKTVLNVLLEGCDKDIEVWEGMTEAHIGKSRE